MEGFSTELQQLWETDRNLLVIGGVRVQALDLDSSTRRGAVTVDNLFGLRRIKVPALNLGPEASFDRVSVYLYDTLKPITSLSVTLGVSYDRQERPLNPFAAPAIAGSMVEDQVSPKIGLLWNPWGDFYLRGAFTRSLNGMSIDQSFRLEPAHVMGFEQAFRSVVPESVAGSLAGESIQTLAVSLEQQIRDTRTFLTLDLQELTSEADRGTLWTTVDEDQGFVLLGTRPAVDQVQYRERAGGIGVYQRIGNSLSASAHYRIADAELRTTSPAPFASAVNASTLQEVRFGMSINHASGFVGSAEASWLQQSNRGYDVDRPGDAFWQFDLHAGWRFYHRRLELLLGLLNLTDQNYRLNPLILEPERPRGRTLTVWFRACF